MGFPPPPQPPDCPEALAPTQPAPPPCATIAPNEVLPPLPPAHPPAPMVTLKEFPADTAKPVDESNPPAPPPPPPPPLPEYPPPPPQATTRYSIFPPAGAAVTWNVEVPDVNVWILYFTPPTVAVVTVPPFATIAVETHDEVPKSHAYPTAHEGSDPDFAPSINAPVELVAAGSFTSQETEPEDVG